MFIKGYESVKYNGIRAGVIPYTLRDHKILFLLGIDRRTRELCDFGGGVKIDEDFVTGAYRELHEESCGIFRGYITLQHIKESPVLVSTIKKTCLFFTYIDNKWLDTAERQFKQRQRDLFDIKHHNELIGVKWVNENDFKRIVYNRSSHCMWRRLQGFIRTNASWIDIKLNLILGIDMTKVVKEICSVF